MTVFKPKEVIAALTKKGFQAHESKDTMFFYYYDGIQTSIYTMVSHRGGKKPEINDSLISKMKRQMHLEKEEFCKFVKCPLTKEVYRSIYEERVLNNSEGQSTPKI